MRLWGLTATASFFPVTAILHHAFFYRWQCILNPFGPEYTIETVKTLITSDSSVALGAVTTLCIWVVGRRWQPLQRLVLAFVLALVPLTIWLWDIPFTARAVCHHFHDGQYGLRSVYFYALGALLFFPALWWIKHRGSLLGKARSQRAADQV
jgi:hypothetical protein